MNAPRMEIDCDKLASNSRALVDLYRSKGIAITAVTKAVCGSTEVARAMQKGGVRSFGDSRIANLQKLRNSGIEAEYMLTRLPMLSEVDEVVEFADISLNSEVSVVRRLGQVAVRRGKTHRVILMVELGDLREGIMPCDIDSVASEAISLRGIELAGIGTNLACYGGIRPDRAKMVQLSAMADVLQRKYGCRLLVSGGNSANYEWFVSEPEIGLINHLRIGESILLGRETLNREPIPGLYTDAFTLVAEVIEVKQKPSKPYGNVAQDAFGRVPSFQNSGPMQRAIVAIGRQDIAPSTLMPRLSANVIGASSDHLILQVATANLAVGSEVKFDVGYSSLLRAMTSKYVGEVYLLA